MLLTLTPTGPCARFHPAIRIAPSVVSRAGTEHTFQLIDVNGVVQVETFHATVADALRQAANQVERTPVLDYRVSEE